MHRRHIAQAALAAAVFAAACLAARRGADAGANAPRRACLSARARAAQADVVLLGNSILQKGIDEDRLAARTGRRVFKLWEGGAASAWWFVAAKNAVAAAAPAPRCALLFFRDEELTTPTYRVEGNYRRNIEEMSDGAEPAVQRLAYGRRWERVAALVRRTCPPYRRRDALRAAFDAALQGFVSVRLLGAEANRFPALAARVFDEDRLDRAQLNRALDDAEAIGTDVLDFDASLRKSFLPLILDTFAARKIPLVLVRAKREPRKANYRADEMRAYIAALARYAEARGVPLWDFSADARIRPEHFASGDHLAAAGRDVFTDLVAARLAPHLASLAK